MNVKTKIKSTISKLFIYDPFSLLPPPLSLQSNWLRIWKPLLFPDQSWWWFRLLRHVLDLLCIHRPLYRGWSRSMLMHAVTICRASQRSISYAETAAAGDRSGLLLALAMESRRETRGSCVALGSTAAGDWPGEIRLKSSRCCRRGPRWWLWWRLLCPSAMPTVSSCLSPSSPSPPSMPGQAPSLGSFR